MDHPPTSPRARSRGFSFRSDKSGGSRGKVDLTESPEDKARRDSLWKGSSKANPNAALNEAQPGVRNVTEESTLGTIRGVQHKDVHGNPIADPDLSNPTRPRLERPLDTIRSFEKAIDNGYKRRSSYMVSQSYDANGGYASKRNSYFGYENGPSPGRHTAMSAGGYYGDRRPDSYYNGPPRQSGYGRRMVSEGAIPQSQRPYPNPQYGYHQSNDTMHTGVTNGSDSTGPWASNTDPSSENSSIDKNMAGGYPQNGYPQASYGSPIIHEEQGAGPAYSGGPVQAPNDAPRRPIQLGNGGDPTLQLPPGKLPPAARMAPEKKKGGWLKRRFSKKE